MAEIKKMRDGVEKLRNQASLDRQNGIYIVSYSNKAANKEFTD
jgi:hypothetical protein